MHKTYSQAASCSFNRDLRVGSALMYLMNLQDNLILTAIFYSQFDEFLDTDRSKDLADFDKYFRYQVG